MTELIPVKEGNIRPRAVLLGVDTGSGRDFELAMKELKALSEACGEHPENLCEDAEVDSIKVVGTLTQALSEPSHNTYIGSGKIEELHETILAVDATCVITLDNLTPAQMKNLQDAIDTEVIDRTGLILNIFAIRARTGEARLQVESARLQYILPRLIGMRSKLGRQGGGSGRLSNKGSGETKLELDRRKIEKRLAQLRKELKDIDKERETQRSSRQSSGLKKVALVGYTNAGKSTLMNKLLQYNAQSADNKEVEVRDMLFATLDTSVRKITPAGKKPFLLSDTVGFVSELPPALIKAFRSTLEEVKYADLLLEVVDISNPEYKKEMEITEKTLGEIGAGDIPVLVIFNKADLVSDAPAAMAIGNKITISASTGEGISELIDRIEQELFYGQIECNVLIPFEKGSIVSYLNQHACVESVEYTDQGSLLHVRISPEDYARYREYITGG